MHESVAVRELSGWHGEQLACDEADEETSWDRDHPYKKYTNELVAALGAKSALCEVGELGFDVDTAAEGVFVAEDAEGGDD